jgi:hypothetical protein
MVAMVAMVVMADGERELKSGTRSLVWPARNQPQAPCSRRSARYSASSAAEQSQLQLEMFARMARSSVVVVACMVGGFFRHLEARQVECAPYMEREHRCLARLLCCCPDAIAVALLRIGGGFCLTGPRSPIVRVIISALRIRWTADCGLWIVDCGFVMYWRRRRHMETPGSEW